MRIIVLAALLLASAACGSGPLARIQAHAASEMRCDQAKLKLTQDKPGVNTFTVEGCGQIARYWTICNIGGYCPDVQGEIVSATVQKQAAFDLQCSAADVQISMINPETFGARGCGRQASYLLVDCNRGACRVVQNTQSQ
jgi:hypothetical protein